MTRHYRQEYLHIRGAMIATSPKPIIENIGLYNPKVNQFPIINWEALAKNPEILAGEFIYQGPKGTEIRIRPPWFTKELRLDPKPGSNRDTWIYFIEKPDSKVLVGVNVLGLERQLVDENLDEIIRATFFVEIESTAADVEQYMRKRVA